MAHSSHRVGDELLELADPALYRAKVAGGGSVRWPEEPVGDRPAASTG